MKEKGIYAGLYTGVILECSLMFILIFTTPSYFTYCLSPSRQHLSEHFCQTPLSAGPGSGRLTLGTPPPPAPMNQLECYKLQSVKLNHGKVFNPCLSQKYSDSYDYNTLETDSFLASRTGRSACIFNTTGSQCLLGNFLETSMHLKKQEEINQNNLKINDLCAIHYQMQ